MNDFPQLLRNDGPATNNWITIRTVGTKTNRSGIGARITCITGTLKQIEEVRSGGSYISQNDLRVHFGLGSAEKVDVLEIRWPSGHLDVLKDLPVNRIITVKEGVGVLPSEDPMSKRKGAARATR